MGRVCNWLDKGRCQFAGGRYQGQHGIWRILAPDILPVLDKGCEICTHRKVKGHLYQIPIYTAQGQ